MTLPSNLYAEKVFAEHPLGLWALDDKLDYISLLSNDDKEMSGWSISSNAEFVNSGSVSGQVSDSPIVGISSSSTEIIEIESPELFGIAELNPDKNTFTISTHFKSAAASQVKLGYILNDTAPITKSFDYSASQDIWAFMSAEFEVPASGNVKMYISIQQEIAVSSQFYFNALSFGQWTEDFATVSSGIVPITLSNYVNIDLPLTTKAVPAQSYGLSNVDGYYLTSSNELFASNQGFPIVYGASNITKIYPNVNGLPSAIIPGFGFLNDSGKYVDMTAEMWLRINPLTDEPRRIFGPVTSTDGLYVQGEFLVIRVGEHIGSYFVSEWGRPMLLDFRVSVNTASLLVDGEQVISITTDTESLVLPKPYAADGKEQNWLGFYSYNDIESMELDCVAIYSYQIPEIVAKRRFVYGQGVEFPEVSSSSLIGASTFIDYQVANYANNYIYPDMGRWNQGIVDNAIVENNSLKSPGHQLPDVVLNNKNITVQEWLDRCSESDSSELFSSVDLSLADSQVRSGGYLYFKKLNMLTSDVKGIYGIFKTALISDQILIKIENSVDGSSFTISTSGNRIKYVLSYGGVDQITTYSSELLEPGIIFVAGIDIDKFSTVYGGLINRFFGSAGKLSVYVGGQSSFENTFNGRIYKVGFSTQRNINKLSNLIDESGKIAVFEGDDVFINAGETETTEWDETYVAGIPETIAWDSIVDAGAVDSQSVFDFMAHIASYTLNPRLYLGSFGLDISADSYWQDYVPLTYFAKSLVGPTGDQELTLDFLQFNITNPAIKIFEGAKYNTENLQVKTYVTFQYLASGPNQDIDKFIYTEKLPKSGIVQPGINWLLTKYEVVDNTIIYLPKDESFKKLAVVLHLEIGSKAIIKNPIKIKSIHLSSQALSSISPTNINTRFGTSLAAYTFKGIYPDYKAFNPVSIYKSSTPYLYLTNSSGIQMKGMLESTKRRGIRSNINPQRSNNYRVGAIQVLAKYAESEFLTTQQKLVTISARNKTISLYAQASNTEKNRAKVVAINDKTGIVDQTVFFYLNGAVVKDLFITPGIWNMIGVQFQESLDFNSFMGYLDITGPLLVHGMSNYRLTSSQDSVTSIFRTWSQVRTMIDKEDNSLTYWQDFLPSAEDSDGIFWEEVLYIPTLKTYLLDPGVVYRLYTGTNKIIVGDSNKLRFGNYSYRMYNDIRWQSTILSAV